MKSEGCKAGDEGTVRHHKEGEGQKKVRTVSCEEVGSEGWVCEGTANHNLLAFRRVPPLPGLPLPPSCPSLFIRGV